jgi:gluconate 2-dehydrogenase gamma chain
MSEENFGRRDFLKSAVLGGAAAATAGLPAQVAAQSNSNSPALAPGYAFLNPEEAAFVETLVDHMIPADEHTPKGTAVGVNIYIDRALAGGWGKGDKLYMQGPWAPGVPEQGYQLPLLPAELYRNGIADTNRYCVKTHGKPFDQLTAAQREEVLKNLDSGKITFDSGLSSRVFFTIVYQTVMEGMFADPIYGGNKEKVGWKMLGFPGVIQVNQQNIVKYRNKKFPVDPISIADMS